jgi:uncharacterized membrane protein
MLQKIAKIPSRFRLQDSQKKIIQLATLGILDFLPVTLYQTGIIARLPDLNFNWLNSNQVNRSGEAYQLGGADGPISLLGYAANIFLASYQGGGFYKHWKIGNKLQKAVALGNAAGASIYLLNMVFRQKKVCLYCVLGALISFLILKNAFQKN